MKFDQNLKDFWLPQDIESLSSGSGSSKLDGKYGNLSAECIEGTFNLLNTTDPVTGFPLIVRMVDAMGKIGPGLFQGNLHASGAYDECLDIGHSDTEYCVGAVTLLSKTLHYPTWSYDMCVPQGCTPEDITIATFTVTFGRVYANSSTISCVSTKRPPYNAGAII